MSGLTVTAPIAGSVTGSAATVTGAAQTAITSVGTLTALAVTGNVSAANLTGTLLTAAQPNVTSVGTLTSLAVTGTATAATFSATNLTGTLSTAAQTAITSVGTLTSLAVSGITNVTNTTNATAFNNGALIVAGGLGVAKDVYIQGNLYVANIISQTTSILTVTDPLLYLSASNPYPYNYDIGIYSHFVGGTGNVYQHTGFVRNDSDNTWRLFSNCVEPSGGQVTYDSNTIFDSLITGSHFAGTSAATLGNATVSWGSIYGTNLYGTLQTAAQPNITSVGTLTALGVSGAITVNSATNATAIINGGTAGVGNIGSLTSGFNTVYAKATSAVYADLAENYAADTDYEPGTVLEFGGEFEVTLGTEGTTRVAGVVSTNPAYLMNSAIEAEFTAPIALQGRVPCKVIGQVRKGDLIVSAGNGFAKASSTPSIGQVIGKAIENFDGDNGVIEVVVGRV